MSGAAKCRTFAITTPSSTTVCPKNSTRWPSTSKSDWAELLGGLGVGDDETRTRGPVEVTPRPVDKDPQAIAKAHQIEKVKAEPGHPPEGARDRGYVGDLGDRCASANGGHDARVHVVKRSRWLSPHEE